MESKRYQNGANVTPKWHQHGGKMTSEQHRIRSVFVGFSLCFRFAFVLLSLCFRFVFALLSLCCRFASALLSVCFRLAFGLLRHLTNSADACFPFICKSRFNRAARSPPGQDERRYTHTGSEFTSLNDDLIESSEGPLNTERFPRGSKVEGAGARCP